MATEKVRDNMGSYPDLPENPENQNEFGSPEREKLLKEAKKIADEKLRELREAGFNPGETIPVAK